MCFERFFRFVLFVCLLVFLFVLFFGSCLRIFVFVLFIYV